MRVSRLLLRDYRQFDRARFELGYPEGHARAGEPLQKICFIGPNGVGKSTLLRLLRDSHRLFEDRLEGNEIYEGWPRILPIFETEDGKRYSLHFVYDKRAFRVIAMDEQREALFLDDPDRFERLSAEMDRIDSARFIREAREYYDAIIYSVAESDDNNIGYDQKIATITLEDALSRKSEIMSRYQEISMQSIQNFWRLLILTVTSQTGAGDPDIIERLSNEWDAILEPTGLYLDYSAIRRPVLPAETMDAALRIRRTKHRLPYGDLSAGLRYFLFRIGHIILLYHRRRIDRGLLLIDEPEGSLYPELLYHIVDIWQRVAPQTGIAVATHSPIIASQFDPAERFVLAWSNGKATVERGRAAEGNTPNHLLSEDFSIVETLGTAGQRAYEEYIDALRKLAVTDKRHEHGKLLRTIREIGHKYNFDKDLPE